MCEHAINDKIEDIRDKARIATIEDKMRKNQLRWFGHMNRRSINAPFRKCD